MQIRPATPDDIPTIRIVLVETWHNTYDVILGADKVTEITNTWHSIGNLSNGLKRLDHAFLVAEVEDRIVGTAFATRRGEAIQLERLYVLPEFQRQGIGSALLSECEIRLRATRIQLEVQMDNTKGRRFYEKHGFSQEQIRPEQADAIVMIKPLGEPPMAATELPIRLVRDDDAQDLFGLVTLCFADYPGCFTDPHDDMKDLRQPTGRFVEPGGFFVMEDARGRVCASIALDFPEAGVGELHRVYVRPDMHRRGIGRRLTALMEERALAHGAHRMILYSDTRFHAAHAMYERMGFVRQEGERPCGDISNSFEYRFEKTF